MRVFKKRQDAIRKYNKELCEIIKDYLRSVGKESEELTCTYRYYDGEGLDVVRISSIFIKDGLVYCKRSNLDEEMDYDLYEVDFDDEDAWGEEYDYRLEAVEGQEVYGTLDCELLDEVICYLDYKKCI